MYEPGVALITGTSTGIGSVICEHMLAGGHEVVALARRPTDISHPRLRSISVDLTDRAATAQAAREAAQRFAITTLVHNAGSIRPALLADVKLDALDALTELHLGSAIALVQPALPAMRGKGFGRIVLLSSRGAFGLAVSAFRSAARNLRLLSSTASSWRTVASFARLCSAVCTIQPSAINWRKRQPAM